MRFRYVFLGLGSLYAILLLLLTDVDLGLLYNLPMGKYTIALISNLFVTTLHLGVLYLAVTAFFDYVDIPAFFKKALSSSEGSGLAIIGIGLMSIAIAIVMFVALS